MNIGLVLSGGMAKGAYQIGALRAISQYIPLENIKYISCASVGVLNGYAYATGNLDCAEQIWRNVTNDDTRLLVNQVLKSSMLQQNIAKLYTPDKQLSSTFYCSLFDTTHLNIVYKDLSTVNNELIPLYLKASVAMPIYNKAVQINKKSYFDGAMIDNIPVFPLLKHNLDYIICVYFDDTCYKFENTHFDNKIIKLTFPSESAIKQSVVVKQSHLDHMIQSGYERTNFLLKSIFSEGYDNLEFVYKAIDYLNNGNQNKNLRITGDVLVTNLNKITQKLTRRKIL